MTFWKGWGVAAALSGGTVENFAPGLSLSKVQFTVGPRFTRTVWAGHATGGTTGQAAGNGAAGNHAATEQGRRLQIFGQALFGRAHGFNGLFPAASSTTTSASSMAIETGAGLDLHLTRHLGLRLLEAEYNRTTLPNNASNAQNDLRLEFGATWILGTK